MSNHFSPPQRPFLTQGDWGEGKKKARGGRWEGKERKRLPIVPRALNAIFTGKPSGSLCIGERSNCYFQKNKNTNDNDTRILSSERRKLLPVSKHNLQVPPGSAQIKRAQRSMARVRELVVPL